MPASVSSEHALDLPFEVATAPQIFKFYKARGFRLENMTISDGHGCSEFVFSRPPEPAAR